MRLPGQVARQGMEQSGVGRLQGEGISTPSGREFFRLMVNLQMYGCGACCIAFSIPFMKFRW